MIVFQLASGSKGNSTFIHHNGVGILIDAGISYRHAERELSQRGFDINEIRMVLVSHEHIDHWGEAFSIASKLKGTVFIKEDQYDIIRNKYPKKIPDICLQDPVVLFIEDNSFEVLNSIFKINVFDTSHDTVSPCGFVVECDGKKVGIVTDLGIMTHTVKWHLAGCDMIIIESNHDVHMVETCSYPDFVKERILSNTGHLSNLQTADFIGTLDPKITKTVVLAHVSEENNSMDKIVETFNNVLPESRPSIHLADQRNGSSTFYL